jgi:predicted short-subunit dehydrogenase-like oxidoreductase (DUF2520 family)
MTKYAIIGGGRVGTALSEALLGSGVSDLELYIRSESPSSADEKVKTLSVQKLASSGAEVLVIAVPDSAIQEVSEMISSVHPNVRSVLHTSGSLSSNVLESLRGSSIAVGSMHPLISFLETKTNPDKLKGAYFCIEGDGVAVEDARALVALVGGASIDIDAQSKPLYHAAAVMACGHVTSLFDIAVEMLSECGLDRGIATKALMSLTAGTIDNIRQAGIESALTGPFQRLDSDNLERNFREISRHAAFAAEAYLTLGLRSLEIALRSGADASAVATLRRRIVDLLKSNERSA